MLVRTWNYLKECFTFQTSLNWRNVISIFLLHVNFFYILIFRLHDAKMGSVIFGYLYGLFGGLAITIGAHRLWTHRTFKAKLPLRIFLMLGYVSTGQYSLVQWARDHRLHHKCSDTDADPHNAKRGFFFSHCGWLMMRRHPEVKEKGKLIDLSDLWEDPVVAFQQKYFVPLFAFLHLFVPIAVTHFIVGEGFIDSVLGAWLFRYCILLNFVWTVNSVAHLYGYKPYNKKIMAVQSAKAAFFTLGEGWHNFHHVFPWDYRIGEHDKGFQVGTNFIHLFEWMGLIYDLKVASPELIRKVKMKNETDDPVYETTDADNNNVKRAF